MSQEKRSRLSPSLLARKILCPAYVPAPFGQDNRVKFLGFHAMAIVKVISRHLKLGYALKGVEQSGPGYRIDLLFESPSGIRRLAEVKSAKKIREIHRLQAALYHHHNLSNEIVVSNGDTDEVLDPEFIFETRRRAEITRKVLTDTPEMAAQIYVPNGDTCYACGNSRCPFQSPRSTEVISPK